MGHNDHTISYLDKCRGGRSLMRKFIYVLFVFALLSAQSMAAPGPFTVPQLIVTDPNPSILYQASGAGSVARTLLSKLTDHVNVMDYAGCDPTGVADSTACFTSAAKAVSASVDFIGNGSTIAVAPVASILVPAGSWLINSVVNTGGKNIVWKLAAGATVNNPLNLNGKIERTGQRISGFTNGIYDYGSTFSVITNSANPETGAQITGLSSPSGLSTYSSRDSVAEFVSNVAPPAMINIASATYTATTIVPATPLTSAQVALLRVGMIIDAMNTPTKYSGFITGWDAGGASITVSNWYLSPGDGTAATPASSSAIVNPVDHVWAQNVTTTLNDNSQADIAEISEANVYNNKALAINGQNLPITWGYDVISSGTYKASAAYVARGPFFYDFEAKGGDVGFQYDNGSGIGYQYSGSGSAILITDGSLNQSFNLGVSGGNLDGEYGSVAAASTPFIDWHSSGNNTDFDSRIIASGGTTTIGQGTLTFVNSLTKMAQIQTSGGIVSTGAVVGAKSVATDTTVGASTITAAQMLTGDIIRSGSTAAYTDTTDTAANIIASIPNAIVGVGYELTIANTVAFDDTIAAGAGVTLAGTTLISASSSRKFVVTITDVTTPAVTITGVSSGGL